MDFEADYGDLFGPTEEAGTDDIWEQGEEEAPRHLSRRHDQWLSPLCPRCQEAEETLYHQMWGCAANLEVEGTFMELAPRAAQEWAEWPCFWLRGLPPQQWTARHCGLPPQSAARYEGCSPEEPLELPAGAALATDGSGGPFTAERRLRRCGWGFAVLNAEGEIVARGWGPLTSWRQTVPLSELEAATQLARCTLGDLDINIDASYVVRGVRRGPENLPKRYTYQWQKFWEAVGGRAVVARKIKAHQSREEALGAGVAESDWAANEAADQLAEQAAMAAQLPAEAVAEVQRLDAEALKVQQHLAAVALDVARRAPSLYGPSSRLQRRAEAAQRARERRETLEEARRLTTHSLDEAGRCKNCLRGPTGAQPALAFLRELCTGRPHAIHATHAMNLTRGLWWCERCGGIGHRKFQKLSRECKRPSASAVRTIARLQKGDRPYHLSRWPDEEDGLQLE
jgi:ribonuclease HI